MALCLDLNSKGLLQMSEKSSLCRNSDSVSDCHPICKLYNKGLVTNYGEGGLQNRRGASEVLPLRKSGDRNSFSYAEVRGQHKFLSSFSATVKGGTNSFNPVKGGGA